MSLISRYVALRLFGFWLLCLSVTLGLVLLGDSFDNLNLFLSGWEGLLEWLRDLLIIMPATLKILLPLTLLFAVRLTHNAFLRTHEWYPMQGAGLSLFRLYTLMWPVLLLVSLLGVLNQNQLSAWVDSRQQGSVDKVRHHIWQLHDSDVIYVRKILFEEALAQGVFVLHGIANSGRTPRISHFKELYQVDGLWQTTQQAKHYTPLISRQTDNADLRQTDNADLRQTDKVSQIAAEIVLPQKALNIIFEKTYVNLQTLGLIGLWQEIRQNRRQEKNSNLYWLGFHQELALMVAPFLLGWLALMIVNPSPKRIRTTDMLFVLLIGILFYFGQEIFFLLGKLEKLHFLVAAWGTNGAVLLASILLGLVIKKIN